MRAGSARKGTGRFAGFAAFVVALVTVPAHADVLDIGDDGAVTIHSGPALYMSTDLKPQPISRAIVRQASHAKPAQADRDIRLAIANSASHYALSPILVSAVAWRESNYDAAAISAKGARGVMQLMPGTAELYCANTCSPSENIDAGAAYLRALLARYDGDVVKALAAYDAGPGTVDRYGGIPPYRETQDYVDAILARLSASALGGKN
jgi:soluble lytic murein transglycosylase-like protein